MITRPLTKDDVVEHTEYMLRANGAHLLDRNTKAGIETARRFLREKLRIQLDIEEYLRRFAFTIGTTIYTPFTPGEIPADNPRWDLEQQFMVMPHECTHVQQYQRLGVAFAVDYAQSTEARAAYEAEAYRCQLELAPLIFGGYFTPEDLAKALDDYGVNEADKEMVAHLLRDSLETVKAGGIINKATQQSVAFLRSKGLVP